MIFLFEMCRFTPWTNPRPRTRQSHEAWCYCVFALPPQALGPLLYLVTNGLPLTPTKTPVSMTSAHFLLPLCPMLQLINIRNQVHLAETNFVSHPSQVIKDMVLKRDSPMFLLPNDASMLARLLARLSALDN